MIPLPFQRNVDEDLDERPDDLDDPWTRACTEADYRRECEE